MAELYKDRLYIDTVQYLSEKNQAQRQHNQYDAAPKALSLDACTMCKSFETCQVYRGK